MTDAPATVAALAIAPVKGLGVVARDAVMLGPHGVEEDRCFFVLDAGGEVVTARRHPRLPAVRPHWDPAARCLRLEFPDGGEAVGGVEHGAPVGAELFGKRRTGHEVRGPFAEALSAYAGCALRLVEADGPGTGWDEGPVTFASRASLAAVARWSGRRGLDPRRFRMLAELEGPGAPFAEDD